MRKITVSSLKTYFTNQFSAVGFSKENTASAADVFLRSTLRNVGHHDVYSLSSHIRAVVSGKQNANPDFKKLAAFGALESWDGGNGIGPVMCAYAMDRAIELADIHGIGLCAMRNTNHFLAAAPYVERAAERGYIALMLAKGGASMGMSGRTERSMSALPMGFAYQTEKDYPVMLDICLAYASNGKLNEMAAKGEQTPSWWGADPEGNPTTDPSEILKGTRWPIGGHKGYSLAMLGEVLTAVLSMGCILDEKSTADGVTNNASHTAIAIKADALMDMDEFRRRTTVLNTQAESLAPGIHIPGTGSHREKGAILSQGYIELTDELVSELNALAEQYGIDGLCEC